MNKVNILLLFLASVWLPCQGGQTIKMLNDSTPAYSLQILEDGFAGYASGTVLSSFCLEKHEYFSPGNSYYGVLSTVALSGGMDWSGGNYDQGPLHKVDSDPIDTRTAFLYTKFVEGDSRFTDEWELQKAIHYIEAEFSNPYVIGSKNSYVTLAEEAVASGGEWQNKGIGNVRVVNLWGDYDGQSYSGWAQDQLILASPVPTPGALLLSGLGISIVGILRRRN